MYVVSFFNNSKQSTWSLVTRKSFISQEHLFPSLSKYCLTRLSPLLQVVYEISSTSWRGFSNL